MSRYDPNITAASPAPGDHEKLLLAIEGTAGAGAGRRDAMAKFLSGTEGWRDAKAALGGAFATEAAASREGSGMEPRLMPGQDK